MTSTSNGQTAYPLAWPPEWPRAKARTGAPFHRLANGQSRSDGYTPKYKRSHSFTEARDRLDLELSRLGAAAVVLSSNVELKLNGEPQPNRLPPEDPGVAVYFNLSAKPVVLACDKWLRVADNVIAIVKHIEALRGQERWGVGSIAQAFAGYLRLAAPGQSGGATWYNALGVSADCTFEAAKAAYLSKAHDHHPDKPGGSHDAMISLNRAWDQARQHFGR